jgi:hypothetical protein
MPPSPQVKANGWAKSKIAMSPNVPTRAPLYFEPIASL